MTEILWDLDWADYFPLQLAEGLTVEVSGPVDALSFLREHAAELTGTEDSVFTMDGDYGAKQRYMAHAADFFLFKRDGLPVGVFIGNAIDWSSYYIRCLVFERGCQGKGMHMEFLSTLFNALSNVGVERVEADTALSNMPCVGAMMRTQFVMCGTVVTDRWGVISKFIRFLSREREEVFLRQFCAGGNQHLKKSRGE